jgi:hypothetical protein
METYSTRVWAEHEKLVLNPASGYQPDIHYPKLVVLTKSL